MCLCMTRRRLLRRRGGDAGAERVFRPGRAGVGQQPAYLYFGTSGARDGNLRPSTHLVLCDDIRGGSGFYSEDCPRHFKRARGIPFDWDCSEFVAVSRYRLCGGRDTCMGVHAGAGFVCSCSWGTAAAGDRQFGISTLRPQSFHGRRTATCGQLELGAFHTTDPAFFDVSICALLAGQGRGWMVEEARTPFCIMNMRCQKSRCRDI
jgi:hypothetical protein